MVARKYRVAGRVQGVGYRYFTRTAALRLGVHGWVRNRPDGNVEVHGEGEAAILDQFRIQLERGSRMSWVSEVVEEPAASSGHTSFDIRG